MKNTKKGCAKPLTLRERIDIESKYKYGESISDIAKYIKRDRSTVYREINGRPRNGRGRYQADIAHREALKRIAKRGNTALLDDHEELREYVVEKLKLGWSPEQISIRLPIDFKKDQAMRISHEAIYTYIYSRIGSSGKVKKGCDDLRIYLSRKHKKRKKKGFRKVQKMHRKDNIRSIDERPQKVEQRKEVGHWEDDLVVSKKSKESIKSVNERVSGVVFFAKTRDHTATAGDAALCSKLEAIPRDYRKTLTRDNGSENSNYQYVEDTLGLMVYYAHPYHSWERGSNENCNRLLRRFFPKGTDFRTVTDKELSRVEYLINTRPRKRLGGLTPAEVFYQKTGVALFS